MTPALCDQPGVCPTPQGGAEMPDRTCSIDGCTKPVRGHGWCSKHYHRWYRHGDPLAPCNSHGALMQRFWRRVDQQGPTPECRPALGPCWLWTASTNAKGYGKIGVGGGRWKLAHRVAYEELRGPIPTGLQLDHLCRNPSCVNPDHLEPVTGLENNRRGLGGGWRNSLKTHCPAGHAYDEANTHVNTRGSRNCRACSAIRSRRRRRLQRENGDH